MDGQAAVCQSATRAEIQSVVKMSCIATILQYENTLGLFQMLESCLVYPLVV